MDVSIALVIPSLNEQHHTYIIVILKATLLPIAFPESKLSLHGFFCLEHLISTLLFEPIFCLRFLSDFRFLYFILNKRHERLNVFLYFKP